MRKIAWAIRWSSLNGIDTAAGYGSPIKTIADGETFDNGKNDGWANCVAIKHPTKFNLVSVYTHMIALSFLQLEHKFCGTDYWLRGGTPAPSRGRIYIFRYTKTSFTYVSEKGGQLYF